MTTVIATPKSAYNGFMLNKATEIAGSISVFVGKNGAGKTRFFQSIKSGSTHIILNGSTLDPNVEITLMPSEQLTPNFGMHHDQNHLNQNIANTIRAYQSYRHLVDLPYDPANEMLGGRMNSNPRYSQIYTTKQRGHNETTGSGLAK
jgi:ABC-type branched-subunit amino acid transport system ATPase component